MININISFLRWTWHAHVHTERRGRIILCPIEIPREGSCLCFSLIPDLCQLQLVAVLFCCSCLTFHMVLINCSIIATDVLRLHQYETEEFRVYSTFYLEKSFIYKKAKCFIFMLCFKRDISFVLILVLFIPAVTRESNY